MRTAVIGGNLQGVEAAYLAHKAGWEVVLIDKKDNIAASGLCDCFIQLDVTSTKELDLALRGVDFVIPALEDDAALASLFGWACKSGLPFAFDPHAYSISSSKEKCNILFAEMNLALPRSWPESHFPLIAKPSRSSGSKGVRIINNLDSLRLFLLRLEAGEEWILQEFVQGPSYSLEVLGFPGRYKALDVTELFMDADYDCKRVITPAELCRETIDEFKRISIEIAEKIKLRGIMDVEVILHNDELKLLEIDARLPSQTPAAVFWSTGRNMVHSLGEIFVRDVAPPLDTAVSSRGVVYEHIKVSNDFLEIGGEHIMIESGPLHIQRNFFGGSEAITNYRPGKSKWIATLINEGCDRREAWERRCQVINDIKRKFSLSYLDPSPEY